MATTRFNVVIIQPDDFNEAKEIADHLKERRPVVINLELLEKEVAHKVFDFLSGASVCVRRVNSARIQSYLSDCAV